MHPLVVLQLVLGVERHGASAALERLVARVYAQVTVQIATLKFQFLSFRDVKHYNDANPRKYGPQ